MPCARRGMQRSLACRFDLLISIDQEQLTNPLAWENNVMSALAASWSLDWPCWAIV